MLPFLKKKKESVAGLIVEQRNPNKDNESEDLGYSLEECAQHIIGAVHDGDSKALADALSEAINKIKEMPKEKSASPHTYEAQNALAGETKE